MWSESSENRSVKIKSLIRFKLANLLVKIVFSCYFPFSAQLLFLDLEEAWFQLCFFMRVPLWWTPNLLRCVTTAILQLDFDFWEVGEVVAKKVWWVVQVLREDWRQCFLNVFPETLQDVTAELCSLTVRTKSQFTTGWMLGGKKSILTSPDVLISGFETVDFTSRLAHFETKADVCSLWGPCWNRSSCSVQ